MSTVLALGCEPKFKEQLKNNLDDYNLIHIDDDRASTSLEPTLEELGEKVVVIIVGSKVGEPVRIAQKVHFIDNNVPIILLSAVDKLPSLTKAIHMSPLLGQEVSAHTETMNQQIIKKIENSTIKARSRRRYEKSLQRANKELIGLSPFSLQANKYLDRIMDVAPIGICLVGPQGRLLTLNRHAQALFNTDEREVLEKPIFHFFGDENVKALEELFDLAVKSTEPQLKIFTIEGAPTKYYELIITNTGKTEAQADILILIQDVTDRVEAIEKEKERARLIALSESKEEFVSLASHQLRTPATSVKVYLDMVLDEYFGDMPEKQREILKTAYDSNERQLKIVDSLLKVARLDAGKVQLHRRDHDIIGLINAIVADEVPKITAKKQTILFQYGTHTKVNLWIDNKLIRMALENLVDNAYKYSPEGSTITIRLKTDKHWSIIDFNDQGIGLTAADKRRLFKKFSRVENPFSSSVEGSGLGLYWSKKIIRMHNGNITVDSRPGEGSTFSVKLPRNKRAYPRIQERLFQLDKEDSRYRT